MNESASPRLKFLPISVFATVMGMTGLTIAWEKAQVLHGFSGVAGVLLAVTALLFVVLLLAYGSKLVLFRAEVLKELHHPVRLSFFPTISISLVLLSIAALEVNHGLSEILWLVGSALHLLFTLYVLSAWINHEHFQIQHMNPAWFIPVVGNILVPIAGVAHGYVEVSWFFFSIGLLFWLVLLTIVFYRIIFHAPLPGKLVPTLFILIAPPAVGFIAYVKLTGGVDVFARLLYYSGLFITLLLFTQVHRFARLKFFLSWWAYSFPLAAITIATFVLHQQLGHSPLLWLGRVLLAVLTLLLALLLMRTAVAVKRGEICVAED
ncbi:MAG: SLAC1 anion channel family protein [Pseudomonadota bacterium]